MNDDKELKGEDASVDIAHAENVNFSFVRLAREYPRVMAVSMALSLAILLFGFDNVIIGSVSAMPAFQRDFGQKYNDQWIIPSTWMGLWTAGTPVGVIVGSALAGSFQNKFGRRPSLFLGSVVTAVGIAIMFVAYMPDTVDKRRGLYLTGKVIEGAGLGQVICTTQTYVSEVAPLALKSSLLTFFPTFTLLGQLIGAAVSYALLGAPGNKSYTTAFASQWAFSAAVCLVAIFVPESPTHLVRNNRLDDALKAQLRLHPSTAEDTIAQLTETIAQEADTNGAVKVTYKHCFKGTNLRRTLICIYTHQVSNMFGIAVLANASYFMQTIGMDASNSLKFLIVGIAIGFVANILSIWTLGNFGRRPVIQVTLALATILWISVGIAGCFRTSTVAMWYIAGAMMAVIFVCGLGAWPGATLVGAETSSLQLRALTQGIGFLSFGVGNCVFNIATPYIYNPDEGNLGGKTGFVLAGVCFVALAIAWAWVPEMRGYTAAEIDEMFEARLPARRFRKVVDEEVK